MAPLAEIVADPAFDAILSKLTLAQRSGAFAEAPTVDSPLLAIITAMPFLRNAVANG